LLVANGIAKGGLFVAAGLFEREFDAYTVSEYAGLARERPVLGGAVAVAFTSLVGLPPTVGFAGKWYLALAAVEVGDWVVAAVVLLSTLLSLTYAARVVERLYLSPAPADEAVAADGSGSGTRPGLAVAVTAIAAVATVTLGLGSTALAEWFAPVVEAWV